MNSKMLDLLSTFLVIGVLIPIIYLTSQNFNNIFSLTILILVSVPTIMAMINGAPFVPTPMDRVRKMIKLSKIKQGDRVYDIGCGDGRIVYIAANEYGAKATGFELSPLVYIYALIRKFIWKSKAEIKFANFKMKNISDADVVFCYLLPECIDKIQNDLTKMLKPGTKIVSYAFEFPEWKLIHKEERDKKLGLAPVWIYEKK
ncbi:hypothetical protein GF376_03030 [Candidatus Peregrinibacteria bacterium]|nr:hypothetical protein [Candidatus Peregrinibacteria bacterium]